MRNLSSLTGKIIYLLYCILYYNHFRVFNVVRVNRRLGFVGGIDPCFGRWDDISHPLTDRDFNM
jgi:hypothetical protein